MLRNKAFALPLVAVLGLFISLSSACIGQSPEKAALEAQAVPSLDKVIEVDEHPKPTNLKDIYMAMGYPEEAKQQKIEGTVIAKVLINEEGEYMRHEIVQEANPLLAAAVEKQLSKLQFSPAKKDGKALKFWVSIPFKFKMS